MTSYELDYANLEVHSKVRVYRDTTALTRNGWNQPVFMINDEQLPDPLAKNNKLMVGHRQKRMKTRNQHFSLVKTLPELNCFLAKASHIKTEEDFKKSFSILGSTVVQNRKDINAMREYVETIVVAVTKKARIKNLWGELGPQSKLGFIVYPVKNNGGHAFYDLATGDIPMKVRVPLNENKAKYYWQVKPHTSCSSYVPEIFLSENKVTLDDGTVVLGFYMPYATFHYKDKSRIYMPQIENASNSITECANAPEIEVFLNFL